MCDAERRLLANALLDQDNERFVLISESCAPLWNFTFTYNYLLNSKESFIGVFDDPGPHGRGRYDQRMLPEVPLEQWRKGAQWFEVERKLAIYIISDLKYYDKFRNFCQPPCYVDEHYIPTMMYIEFKDKIAKRSVTAVDWSKGGSHPGIFGRMTLKHFTKPLGRIKGAFTMVNPVKFAICLQENLHPTAYNPCYTVPAFGNSSRFHGQQRIADVQESPTSHPPAQKLLLLQGTGYYIQMFSLCFFK